MISLYKENDFVHLVHGHHRIDSGVITKIEGFRIFINGAVANHNNEFDVVYCPEVKGFCFSDEEGTHFAGVDTRPIRVNPCYHFSLEKDERRLPIAKTGYN